MHCHFSLKNERIWKFSLVCHSICSSYFVIVYADLQIAAAVIFEEWRRRKLGVFLRMKPLHQIESSMQKPIVVWWKTFEIQNCEAFCHPLFHFTSLRFNWNNCAKNWPSRRLDTSQPLRPFRETFLLSFSFLFFLEISLFIFRHLHAEEISTANRPCGTFSPLLESTATSNFPQKQRPPVERFDWMQWCDYSICLFVHSVFVLCLFYIAFFEDLRNFCFMLIISLLLKWSTFWWARE